MNREKGFTLIELLAVIVILAIIALISVPIVLNMIEKSKKSAAKSSALGFIEAIEYNNGYAEEEQPGYITIEDAVDIDITTLTNLKFKGKRPTSGKVTIENGLVKDATLCVEGYKVTYVDKELMGIEKKQECSSSSSNPSTPVVIFGGTKVAAGTNDTHKGIVYMNPKDLSATCNASNSVSTTGTKEGCLKFYIYDDSGDNYKMILDHNTTATVVWVSKDDYNDDETWNLGNSRNSKGPLTANAQLATDTTGWGGSPRLITADEIVTITDSSTFNDFNGISTGWFYFDGTGTRKQTQAANSSIKSKYAWLFDYTNECTSYGCNIADSSNKGYWTSNPVNGDMVNIWSVHRSGSLYYYSVSDSELGIRPVITVSKSALN